MYVSGAAAEAAAGGGGRHHAAGGAGTAAYSPVKSLDAQGGVKCDTSEHVVIGFAFNALSTVFVMLMASCAKLAGQNGLPVMDIFLARSSVVLVFALVTVGVRRQNPCGNHKWLLLGRSLCGFAGICLWYTALLLLPLSDVVVFGFLTPLIVALLSPLLVKEHPSWMVLAMTPVCIIGVILCLKPPFIFGGKQHLNSAGIAAALFQAFVGSLVKLSVRELRKTDHPNVIILWLGTVSSTGATAACLLIPGQWVTPKSLVQASLLLGTGISAYLFQVTMTMGLRRMQAAPSAAVSYLSVVWGALAGTFIFNEYLTAFEVAGAIVICFGTMAVVASEGWQQHMRAAQETALPNEQSDDEEAQLLAVELSIGKGRSSQSEHLAVNGSKQ